MHWRRTIGRMPFMRFTSDIQRSTAVSCRRAAPSLVWVTLRVQLWLFSDYSRLVFYFCLMRINRKVLTFKLTLFSTLVIPESFDSFIFCSSFSEDVNNYYFSNNSCIKLNAHWKARFLASSRQFPVLVYSHYCKLVWLCIFCTLKKWSIILKLNFIS